MESTGWLNKVEVQGRNLWQSRLSHHLHPSVIENVIEIRRYCLTISNQEFSIEGTSDSNNVLL